MQVSLLHLCAVFQLIACARSYALVNYRSTPNTTTAPSTLLKYETIYQFPLPTSLENVAVRSNGDLLLIQLSSPNLWILNPITKEAKIIATIPDRTSLFAVAERSHDVFYVSAGNFSMMAGKLDPGSFTLYSVTISSCEGKDEEVEVKKVLDLPEAILLNGMVTLPRQDKVLIPDSYKGVVWGVDVKSKEVSVAIDLPEMHSTIPGKVGINGIKLHDRFLYFTNSQAASLYRVAFDKEGGAVMDGAEVVKVATAEVFMDDFTIDRSGILWITTNAGNVILAVNGERKGKADTVVVAGKKGSLDVGGPTACAFGRTKEDQDILYVVTTGGLGGGVDGGAMEGGKVVAVDTKGFHIR